jgi:hypothetical protein
MLVTRFYLFLTHPSLIRMGSFFLERIDRCIRDQQEIDRMGSYKPRSGGIGKAVAKYSPELFDKIMNDEELRGVMKHLHYHELLEKPPEEWSTLTPLENYAIEYVPSWAGTEQKKVVLLNNGNLARTKNEETPWRKIKAELGLINETCNCAECMAERAERAAMDKAETSKAEVGDKDAGESEEKKLEDETENVVDGKGEEKEVDGGNEDDEEYSEEEEKEEIVERNEEDQTISKEVKEEKTAEMVAGGGDDEKTSEEEDWKLSNEGKNIGNDVMVATTEATEINEQICEEGDDEDFEHFLSMLKDFTC